MKYIRSVSDIHLDWDILNHKRSNLSSDPMTSLWFPVSLDEDYDTTLVIAGDLWTESKFIERLYQDGSGDSWMSRLARKFKYIVFVLGNHDYWRTNVQTEVGKIKKLIKEQKLSNVFLLENDVIILDQVKFVGGTLWTDFNKHNPLLMYQAPFLMNDYKFMRYGLVYRKCNPQDLYKIHCETRSVIFSKAKKDDVNQRVVVVTHMAPSYQSVHERYRNVTDQDMNFLYFSDLDNQIIYEGEDIDFWFHGHMHHPTQYEIGNCKVVLNPRGYSGEGVKFNPTLRFEI